MKFDRFEFYVKHMSYWSYMNQY